MSVERRHYTGFLELHQLEPGAVQAAERALREFGLDAHVSSTALDFEFVGRDPERTVERLLCQLAPIIGDAEGEFECRNWDDERSDSLDYYSIRGGKLYRRPARIVRGVFEPVSDPAASTSRRRHAGTRARRSSHARSESQ